MTRNHLIALCAFLLPTMASAVGIGLIMSANEEVRALLQNPAVANGFLQCFVDRSRTSFPISQQVHLHTVTDVIRSFILKSSLYPITDKEALLFQTEIASSIVDVVVNEPSQQEDYAQTLASLNGILRDCYAQSTGKPTTDLAIIVETFTKLFVDVIVSVGKSSTLKISAEEQNLLRTFEQVERYGFVNGEDPLKGPLEIALQSEIEVENKASQSALPSFQSSFQKPTVISTSIEKPISVETIVNLPPSPLSSNLGPALQEGAINSNQNQNAVKIVSLNSTTSGSTTFKSPTEVFPNTQTESSSKLLPTPIANGNSNSATAASFNQKSIVASESTVPGIQASSKAIASSDLAAMKPQNIQSSITSESMQTIPQSNFPEPAQDNLSKTRVLRSISSPNKSMPISQRENPNGIFSGTSEKMKNKVSSNPMSKVFTGAIKQLIKSGNEKILSELMTDAIAKQNFFDPEFVNQIKEQASKLLLNTITSLSMSTTIPITIGQILTKILSPEYVSDFALSLYDTVKKSANFDNSDDRLKFLIRTFVDGIGKILTPFASQDENYADDNKRRKRDNADKVIQAVGTSELTPDNSLSSASAVSEASFADVSAVSTASENSFENNFAPSVVSTFPLAFLEATSSSTISTGVVESTAIGHVTENAITNFNVEAIATSEDVLPGKVNNVPIIETGGVSQTNEAESSLSSFAVPAFAANPNIAAENSSQPSDVNGISSAFSEAVAFSGISSDANNNKNGNEAVAATEVALPDITSNIYSLATDNSADPVESEVSPDNELSPPVVLARQQPAIVSEFSSALSKASASSEAVTIAVELTLHGPTANNTIYNIIFTSLSEKGITDPTVESRDSSYPIASNLDGVTPIVFTNALSAAVADTLLEEGLLTFENIPTTSKSYIRILEDTLDELEAGDDPQLNSKALVIGTERFISSRGISVLHGASELESHFKEDFLYAWEQIMRNRDSYSLFPDTNKKESNDVKAPNLKCESDPSNPTSFSSYLLKELRNSNSLKGLFSLPPMTAETADAFYRSFYSAAMSLGIEIPKQDGHLFWNVLSTTLDAKSPVFFATIYVRSLEKFLCKRGVLKQGNSLWLSRLFSEILNRTPSAAITDGRPDGYFDKLINTTFHFLISLLIIKPISPVSWTSNFLHELISTSPVSFPRLIRQVAPEILSPAGLRHPDASKRIYDLAVSLAHDVLAPGSTGINIPALAKRMAIIKSQIRTSNPALKPIGLLLGTFLEAISALVTLLNAAKIPNLHFSTGDASTLIHEMFKAFSKYVF